MSGVVFSFVALTLNLYHRLWTAAKRCHAIPGITRTWITVGFCFKINPGQKPNSQNPSHQGPKGQNPDRVGQTPITKIIAIIVQILSITFESLFFINIHENEQFTVNFLIMSVCL